jgi:hypothetical protein
VIGFTVAGQDYFPSTGYATLDAKTGTEAIQIAATGAGPEDGFAGYTFFGYNRPRWGDFSAAAVDGQTVWVASEYIANSGTVDQFQADPTLGGTRTMFANWDNRITPVSTSAGSGSSMTGTAAGGPGSAAIIAPVINNNANRANITNAYGGIYALNSTVTLQSYTVHANQANGSVIGEGGGVDGWDSFLPLVATHFKLHKATTAFDDLFGGP